MATMTDRTESSAGGQSFGRKRIPDLPVIAHTGKPALFYSDLVRGRIVLVNFMAIASHADNPISANLVEVARALGADLGEGVQMLSITVDPANDGPAQLAQFGRRLGAPAGWLFLTGAGADLEALRRAFFQPGAAPAEAEEEGRRAALTRLWGAFANDPRALFCQHPSALQDCSTGLVRYGNDALGLWGSVPARARPEQILSRISWLRTCPPREPSAPVRRGGPFPPASFS